MRILTVPTSSTFDIDKVSKLKRGYLPKTKHVVESVINRFSDKTGSVVVPDLVTQRQNISAFPTI